MSSPLQDWWVVTAYDGFKQRHTRVTPAGYMTCHVSELLSPTDLFPWKQGERRMPTAGNTARRITVVTRRASNTAWFVQY